MTKQHALKMLLSLEPLTVGEMVTYTGWPVSQVWGALKWLAADGVVERIDDRWASRWAVV